ncbi:MAG: hypothetical protein PHZ00_00210 [Candidatus Peribacteraceae bacterium]|nr:hypothetical protein [Candidatus Peribacteraceae bacterium]
MPTCLNAWCRQHFEISDTDLEFYEKVSPVFKERRELVPPPTLCPGCRMQRRFSHRNERHLYRRHCALSGRPLITIYPPDSPCTVYDKESWWGENWDPLTFGRSFSESEDFFSQFQSLRTTVPRLGTIDTNDEGSAYCSFCAFTKHCYLCTSCVVNENSLHCYQANDSRDCCDCYRVTGCELCYECIHCHGLNSCQHCKDCDTGSGLLFCDDCRGCNDCIGCKNLVNKSHWINNAPSTGEQVEALKTALRNHSELLRTEENFRSYARTLTTRASHLVQCENCTGDHLRNCRNTVNSYDAINLEDCSFMVPVPQGAKDCRDAHYCPNAELLYECLSGVRANRCLFSLYVWDDDDMLYSEECFSCKHCFGCVGLRHKQYCVLNKQYMKAEYEELVPRIIGHMRKTNEWGEFLSAHSSFFPYNLSIAQEDFPLTQHDVETRGWHWRVQTDEIPNVDHIIPAAQLPDRIDQIPDDILNWAIECDATKRPFRIIKQELDFYRQMHVPVPRFHPDERHRRRMALRNPRKLWKRNCGKCGKEMETTYSPERPEIVYCESCYLKEVY